MDGWMDGWMEWGEDEDDDDLFSQSISVCMYALARSLDFSSRLSSL